MEREGSLYDPTLTRFFSPDSIVPAYGNPQALNRYSYVLKTHCGIRTMLPRLEVGTAARLQFRHLMAR